MHSFLFSQPPERLSLRTIRHSMHSSVQFAGASTAAQESINDDGRKQHFHARFSRCLIFYHQNFIDSGSQCKKSICREITSKTGREVSWDPRTTSIWGASFTRPTITRKSHLQIPHRQWFQHALHFRAGLSRISIDSGGDPSADSAATGPQASSEYCRRRGAEQNVICDL